jgi:sugar phosphate isomerase/epimerase
MKQIGFRAHDLGRFPSASFLAASAATYQKDAYLQLVPQKAFASFCPPEEYDEERFASMRTDLERNGARVAVLGCYINPVHPDEEERRRQLQEFEASLRVSGASGALLVGTETGSTKPDGSYDIGTFEPEILDRLYRSIEQMLDAAERYGATIGIEPVSRLHTICSVQRTVRLLETFDTPRLKVIYDPVNLVPWTGIPEQDGSMRRIPTAESQQAFFEEALDAFGKKIAILHVKDYLLDEQGYKIGNLPVGRGVLDWKILERELDRRDIRVPWLLEEIDVPTLRQTLLDLAGQKAPPGRDCRMSDSCFRARTVARTQPDVGCP